MRGATECEPCRVGEAVETDGQGACVKCKVGTFAPYERAQQCDVCGADQFQNEEGQSTCKPCPAGTYTDCAVKSKEMCKGDCQWQVQIILFCV